MRELIVLRHAKSSWDDIDKSDHDRRLTPRGIEAARRMGALMLERGWVPDRILCSTATRTKETLELVRAHWPAEPPIATTMLATLYLATPSRLLEIARRQPDEARRVLVIGHNPGLHSFLTRLAGYGDKGELNSLSVKFPTAALAIVAFETATWQELDWTTGRLVDYHFPKKLDATSV